MLYNVCMNKQWDRVTKTYDEFIGEEGDLPHRLLFNPALEGFLKGKTFTLVLDAGCGNGYWTRRLSRLSREVIGVDASREMVKIASSKTNPKNVQYTTVDIGRELPFPNETFDLVFSNMVFHYIRNLKFLASEIFRVLKPGGILIFSISHPDYERSKDPTLNKIQKRTRFTTQTLGGRAKLSEYYEPFEGYKRKFLETGFTLIGLKEPAITNKIARLYPRYKDGIGIPRAAVFCWEKPYENPRY